MKRLDAALVELKLAPSRTKAQRMIEAGEVEIKTSAGWQKASHSSQGVAEPSMQNIRTDENARTLKYVSRGGLKLEGALSRLRLNVNGWRCLDVGISTGGFSDCLLQNGAREVLGLDVGHDQLAGKLRAEAKLKQFEGVNVRDLAAHAQVREWVARGLDLCVVDVAFISLQLVFPVLGEILPLGCGLLALVKPQFEVGADGLDKNGIVKDAARFSSVEDQVLRALGKYGFSRLDYFAADVKGQDGNQEFFAFARRN